MGEIFLSASIPIFGRGDYYKTSDPFLIQCAVRELIISVIRFKKIVWGGHPAITPMVWIICQDLNIDYSDSVILYQSKYFEDRFPEENAKFKNVVYVDEVSGDREASLQKMREAMLSRQDLEAAVFIGGMDGIETEYSIFKRFHPEAKIVPLSSPGGASRQLVERFHELGISDSDEVDFARIFHKAFPPPKNY